ncbi:MAG: alpha-hydroxy-acid oxidizing protein [Desulfarculaceae bacterium]|nr:alpha-hydroxy-acid oxidizing protein [Desulfarculaceae bacterium]MCF8072857.1 alpha-hydroxy-acid oxidizing protein [Desulfarculaceae bacterium]MCF8101025.1 alpha-hydroxy-acid oxidizing protein [Desulfarculaceae bacterium]MCF8115588.1 alpha-hydroxy-acid oxidizing protein [Desulfarculaceae bacterium]
MTLGELYAEGQAALEEKGLAWLLNAVETGFVLEHDRRVLDSYTLKPRYIDAPLPDTAVEVLGVELASPVVMSAVTMPIPKIAEHGMSQMAEGLREAGSLLWCGTPVPANLAELCALELPVVANAKPFRERGRIFEMIEQFQKAGATWIGLEIDAAEGTKIGDQAMVADCAPLSLAELREIRREVQCPLILKGVLSAEDAAKAAEAEADGIVVSNHGGHTLDYLPHALQVLDEIRAVARDRLAIVADGGIRRGSDVLKCLAMGADLVGVVRPLLWGLAADGSEGVRGVISGLGEELRRIMGLLGAASPRELNRTMLIPGP